MKKNKKITCNEKNRFRILCDCLKINTLGHYLDILCIPRRTEVYQGIEMKV